MVKEVFKRCEKKYMLNQQQYGDLRRLLEQYMLDDAYNRDGRFYTISNLYFDTPDDYYIRQSISKPLYKEKLRLRSYGTPSLDSKVYLELKKKYQGTVHKRRSAILLEDAYHFIDALSLSNPGITNFQVLREITYLFRTHPSLEPRLYLSYERKAMFAKDDPDLRITFDRNIMTRRTDLRLESGNYGTPLLKDDLWLMEVKAVGSLPLWLTNMLTQLEIYSSSFSKYGAEYQRHILQSLQKEGKDPCLKPSLKARLNLPSPSEAHSLAS